MMRTGRPPKKNNTQTTTLTIRIKPEAKNLIVELADGYDMTLTEYILTLIYRDATNTNTSN